jgi:hypothetical protein
MKTRTNFKLGDVVHDRRFLGNGLVVEIDYMNEYPLKVKFSQCPGNDSYTLDGRYQCKSPRTLFFGPLPEVPKEWIEIEDKSLLTDLKIDDKVMVRDDDDEMWERRRFAGIHDDGLIMCFNLGADSWSESESPSEWKQWRLPTEEELKERKF